MTKNKYLLLTIIILSFLLIGGVTFLNKGESDSELQEENKFGGLTLLSSNNNVYEFAGKIEVSGTYFRESLPPINYHKGNEKEMTCLEFDEDSHKKIPKVNDPGFNTDNESGLDYFVCFNDSSLAESLSSLGESGEADLVIGNLKMLGGDYINRLSADLIAINKVKSRRIISDISTWEDYKNEKYGYSFKIPPGYFINYPDYVYGFDTVRLTNRLGILISSICQCGGENIPMIDISIWGNKDNLSLRDWLIENIEKVHGGYYDIDKIINAELGGINGLSIDVQEMGGGTITIVGKNNLIYMIRGYNLFSSESTYKDFVSNFKL